MAKATMRTQGGEKTYEPLPADIYHMRVRDADVTESAFKDAKTGETQYQLALTWEISRLTAEQQEAEVDDSRWVRQWLSLYYGDTKSGPSKLKAFVDSLQSQGLLEEFDASSGEIDSDWFVGIEQRVTLDVKGAYNNVVMISRPKKTAAKPTPTPPAPAPKKNAPVRVEQATEDDEDLFAE